MSPESHASDKKKILVNCVVHDDGLAILRREGYEVIVVPEVDQKASWDRIPACVALLANASLPLNEKFFAAAPQLKVIGRHGVGYDNVDLDAARRHGIRVVNTPLPIIEPVAEHTIMLMLAAARRLVPGYLAVIDGRWRQPENTPGPELLGKTLGLIGMGNTGKRLAEIAALGFRMKIVYFDKIQRHEAERSLGAERLGFEELLARSDFVSIHVNLTAETRGMMNSRAFGLMKQGAFFINCARGLMVDERALLDALNSGRLAGAGLDVFAEEPPPRDHPLLRHPLVTFVPHMGGGSNESKLGCALVARDIVKVLNGEEPSHPVV